jgi:hypothetical protein
MKRKKRSSNLILEFTEFNLQRLNPEAAVYPLPNVQNKELSTDAWDGHQSAIQNSIVKLNTIMGSLSNSSQISALRSKVALENQKIQKLFIQRIFKKNYTYDAYVKFEIDEKEYWGVIYDLLGPGPTFKSEVFDDTSLLQPKEWVIKISGLIIKWVKEFLRPDFGNWKVLDQNMKAFCRRTGTQIHIQPGQIIKVVAWDNNKIIIEYELESYELRGDNFVYFKWWAEKED